MIQKIKEYPPVQFNWIKIYSSIDGILELKRFLCSFLIKNS